MKWLVALGLAIIALSGTLRIASAEPDSCETELPKLAGFYDQLSADGRYRQLVVSVQPDDWSIDTGIAQAVTALRWAAANKRSFGLWAQAQCYDLSKATDAERRMFLSWKRLSPEFGEVIVNIDPPQRFADGFQIVLNGIPDNIRTNDLLVVGRFSGTNDKGAGDLMKWCDAGAATSFPAFCRDATPRFCRSTHRDGRCG
ncbi:hypothetical protein C3941_09215 [Kaistia algarum]|uniref:hypothetical protein n=1 Tax=Kaistia algarum TaxID=2083279 RepID=UPI000CE8B796|nr:hypothetical protein [Kaistia algarum]MCX5512237.1 hypothetical protein [Kaistia algarum]PPE80332.1 hypothetical protein C3941_09215 [Kaistia algarum]